MVSVCTRILLITLCCFKKICCGYFEYSEDQLRDKKNIVPIAVIGSGPAGLSAGLYGSRDGYYTFVFKGPKPGGQIADSMIVENWPGVPKGTGVAVMRNLENQTESFGAQLIDDTITKVDFNTWPFTLYGQDNEIYHALTVIIATGATPRKLGVPGEDQFWLKGILSCGLCDAPLAKGYHVVVTGGNDAAIERVLQLIPYAQSITLIVADNELSASTHMKNKLESLTNVTVIYNNKVVEFLGDNKELTGVRIKDVQTNKTSIINARYAFLSDGFKPNTVLFKNSLQLGPQGHILHDCQTQETNIKAVYVAGTAGDPKYKQAVTASAEGAKCAVQAIDFIHRLNFDIKKYIKKRPPESVIKESCSIPNIDTIGAFNKKIGRNPYTLVEFYLPMCSVCQQMTSIVNQVASEFKDKILTMKVDREKCDHLAAKYEITSVPAFILFKNGKEISRVNGPISKQKLTEFVKTGLSGA